MCLLVVCIKITFFVFYIWYNSIFPKKVTAKNIVVYSTAYSFVCCNLHVCILQWNKTVLLVRQCALCLQQLQSSSEYLSKYFDIKPPAHSFYAVSCRIWEGSDCKKAELSLIDIASTIIHRADQTPERCDYLYLAIVLSFTVAVFPVIFHVVEEVECMELQNMTGITEEVQRSVYLILNTDWRWVSWGVCNCWSVFFPIWYFCEIASCVF